MATCEVCGANCRGKCGKCGARLCAKHKPWLSVAKCSICLRNYGRQAQQTPARSQRPGQAHQSQGGTAYYTPRTRPDFKNMNPDEIITFMQDRRAKLEKKQQRERAYLDRRAARGTYTPTDEAYEADQLLEFDLLDLLDFIAQEMSEK